MIEKPWHKHYPANMDREIDVRRYQSLIEVFDNSVKLYPNHVAYTSFSKSISYQETEELSAKFGAYLQQELGIKKGDRVAVMCPNTLAFAIAMWGIIRIGAVQVSVNPLYSPRELKHQLNDAQVKTIVIFSASTPTLADIIEKTSIEQIIVTNLDDLVNSNLPDQPIDPRIVRYLPFVDCLAECNADEISIPLINHEDLVFLQYTGGTTGLSKGAMLCHRNIIANILQFEQTSKEYIVKGEETIITAIPMYHIFALTVNTLANFAIGSNNVLIANPRDMDSFVKIWQSTKASLFTGVNTLFNGLVHTAGFSDIDFSTLKLSIGGGAPVQESVSKKWQEYTGKRIHEGYGLSETSPIVTMNHGTDDGYVSGIGIPVPSTDISIRDDDENLVVDGESGELCVKGPQVMQGYWKNLKATQECMTKDGYFKTGDIAVLDDLGFFHIVDRKKDMILVSGFNVFPNEIEDVVSNMEGVLESACIGVKNEKSGEAPKLFVVKAEQNISEQNVIDFCRKSLAAYKIPREVVFINELPKSTVGKLLRRELRNY